MIRNLIRQLRLKLNEGRLISRDSRVLNSQIGEWVQVTKNANIVDSVIGRFTSIGRNTNVYSCHIGNFCSVSWNVTLGAPSHPMNRPTSHAFPYVTHYEFVTKDNKFRLNTEIGHDVWIGANAIILPGVKIGNGAVIGAGSVVTKDIKPYEIVVGNPGKTIRMRFDEDTIEMLNQIEWWNWSRFKIHKNIEFFQQEVSCKAITSIVD